MVIGISGATWTVIDPMLSTGRLPNLRDLMRRGSWGVLESVKTSNDKHYRPQTAWPSIFSGVTDVMPTLLRAAGLETPPGLDGKVLDLFT